MDGRDDKSRMVNEGQSSKKVVDTRSKRLEEHRRLIKPEVNHTNKSLILSLLLLIFIAVPCCGGSLISSVDAAKEIYNQTEIEPAGWVDSGIIIDMYSAIRIKYDNSTINRTIPIAVYFWSEMPRVLSVEPSDAAINQWPFYPLLHDVKFSTFTMTGVNAQIGTGEEKIQRTLYYFTEIVDIGGGYLQAIEVYPNPRIEDTRIGQTIKVAYESPPEEWVRFTEEVPST